MICKGLKPLWHIKTATVPDLIGLAEQLVERAGVFSSLYKSGAGLLGFASPLQCLHKTPSTNRASVTTGAVIRNLSRHIAIPVCGVKGTIPLPLLTAGYLTALSAKKNYNGGLAAQQDQDNYIKQAKNPVHKDPTSCKEW